MRNFDAGRHAYNRISIALVLLFTTLNIAILAAFFVMKSVAKTDQRILFEAQMALWKTVYRDVRVIELEIIELAV